MECPSAILDNLSHSEKKSLAGIVAVSLPADDLAGGMWSLTFLEAILMFLDLDKDLAEGFYPITERARRDSPPPDDTRAAWEKRIEPFRASLPPLGEPRLIVLRDLMVVVALCCGYDARTRVTFRRVCEAMQVPWHPRVAEVESTLARKVYERVTAERQRELRGDRWRGFKIGAAMVGGGALLAVTGGLAAPAFAAGLAASSSIIGASAAATLSGFASTAWMATVFGATGAGLVGFKMDRRTKGVKEFEFESETSVGEEMCVSICVPGIMKDKADLQRGWGVEPRGDDVSAKERLSRFYYVYNKDKVPNVELLLKEYDGQEARLCRALMARYGVDPRDPPTREALALAEGRNIEGVAQEDVIRDAQAIGELMRAVLDKEKKQKGKEKVTAKAAAKQNIKERPNEPAQVAQLSPFPRRAAGTAHPSPSIQTKEEPQETTFKGYSEKPTYGQSMKTTATGRTVSDYSSHPTSSNPTATTWNGDDKVMFRDWDRTADGQVETLQQGMEGLTLAPAIARAPENVKVEHDGIARGISGDAGSKGVRESEEIEMWVTDDDAYNGDKDGKDETRKNKDDLLKHRVWFWQDKLPHTDQYVLRWESELLVTLGSSVEAMIKTFSQNAIQETLKYTTLAALVTSLAWPLALISLSNIIDADWTIGCERADIAGKILADALLNREQGCRPVTLVGTSIGARLIFSCLEEIARRHELWEEQMWARNVPNQGNHASRTKLDRFKNAATPDGNGKSRAGLNGVGLAANNASTGNNFAASSNSSNNEASKHSEAKCAAGVIENVCLLGAPVGASAARWERVARVVHGRMINGYSKSDIILGLVFRAKSLSLSIAGVQKVAAVGVENVDLLSLVGLDHFNYNRRMPEILSMLALDDSSKYISRGDTPERRHSVQSPDSSSPSSVLDGSRHISAYGTTAVL